MIYYYINYIYSGSRLVENLPKSQLKKQSVEANKATDTLQAVSFISECDTIKENFSMKPGRASPVCKEDEPNKLISGEPKDRSLLEIQELFRKERAGEKPHINLVGKKVNSYN